MALTLRGILAAFKKKQGRVEQSQQILQELAEGKHGKGDKADKLFKVHKEQFEKGHAAMSRLSKKVEQNFASGDFRRTAVSRSSMVADRSDCSHLSRYRCRNRFFCSRQPGYAGGCSGQTKSIR